MTRLDLWWALGLTALFEAVTCLFRFGLGMQSTRDTGTVGAWTFGLRIHHGYVGVVMVAVAFAFPAGGWLRAWLLRIGLALVLSDLAHHFLVLWPVTGSPHFDLTYPRPGEQ